MGELPSIYPLYGRRFSLRLTFSQTLPLSKPGGADVSYVHIAF